MPSCAVTSRSPVRGKLLPCRAVPCLALDLWRPEGSLEEGRQKAEDDRLDVGEK